MGKDLRTTRDGRPHRIPPPPKPAGEWIRATALESVAAAGGSLWLVLWQAVRDVWLWADVMPEDRGELFAPPDENDAEGLLRVGEEAPALTDALETFHRLRVSPQAVEGREIVPACRQVYEWAEARSMVELAAFFADAAAIADPESPYQANQAARLCRRGALERRAAVWYERGFRLAVRDQNREEIVSALLGYGALLYGLGLHHKAKPLFEKVATKATRTGRRRIAAEAYHDLLLLCAELGELEQATSHARQANDLYPRKYPHPRVPYFVHDFSFLLIRRLYYSAALSLLRKLPAYFPRPEEQVLVWGTLARAAAGAGQVESFRQGEQKVLELVDSYREYGGAALVLIAEGAWSLSLWEDAERYLRKAVEMARERRDREPIRVARRVLRSVNKREPAPRETPAPADVVTLVRQVAARLRSWKGPR